MVWSQCHLYLYYCSHKWWHFDFSLRAAFFRPFSLHTFSFLPLSLRNKTSWWRWSLRYPRLPEWQEWPLELLWIMELQWSWGSLVRTRQRLLSHDRTRKILAVLRTSLGLPAGRIHQRGGKSSALRSRMASLEGRHPLHAVGFQGDLADLPTLVCLHHFAQWIVQHCRLVEWHLCFRTWL